jgi:hypothetical protein
MTDLALRSRPAPIPLRRRDQVFFEFRARLTAFSTHCPAFRSRLHRSAVTIIGAMGASRRRCSGVR